MNETVPINYRVVILSCTNESIHCRVKQIREEGGVNHYNVIQVKGRAACRGQPRMGDDGSVKY